MQLWIPKAKRGRENIRDRFSQSASMEGSQVSKKPKQQELDQLRDFAGAQHASFADPFFSTPVGTAAGPQALGPKGKGKGKTRKSGDGPGKTAKIVNLPREVPKLGQAMEKQLEKVASEIDKNMDMATTAAECIKIASLSLNDRASCSYKVSLQFRHQIMTRWSGDQNTVIMLEAGHVEEASEVVAPAEEHTPKKARLAEELGGEQDSRGIQKVQDLESWSF